MALAPLLLFLLAARAECFSPSFERRFVRKNLDISRKGLRLSSNLEGSDADTRHDHATTSCAKNGALESQNSYGVTRRQVMSASIASAATFSIGVSASNAAVGSLPEFADTNAILQGITINVADQSQQKQTIDFLTKAFDFKVLRSGKGETVEDTWLGYGPEQLSIPDDFEIPVSSFAEYGGHASVRVRYDTQATAPLYRTGDAVPGNNIAFFQVGVLGYRISQMTSNGGTVLDAYGHVNALSPAGVPVRGIVGFRPDPLMMVAINCEDVQASAAFYQRLGFSPQVEYPFARLSKGTTPLEPAQPGGSIYMAPTPNGLGVLLQPLPKKRQKVVPNPAVECLNIVYTPAAGSEEDAEESFVVDPSGVKIRFQPVNQFIAEERSTRR